MQCFTVLLCYALTSVGLALVIEKSKKCLDFTFTTLFLHFVITCFYGGEIPSTWTWWIVNLLGGIIMVCVGEYICSRWELSDIPSLLG